VNPIGNSYVDGFGDSYFLHNVWNLDERLWNSNPYTTRPRPSAKVGRADGFLMVTLDGAQATCEMHGYRNSSSQLVWSVSVAAKPALSTRY
jgi:hypothetical protein